MSVIVVGTMAFDAIETPFGKTDKILLVDFIVDISSDIKTTNRTRGKSKDYLK